MARGLYPLTVANASPLPIVDPRSCWDRLRA
jgi:hypothetical protein